MTSCLLALPFSRVETLWQIQKGTKDWLSYILGSCGIRYSALQRGRDIVIHPERDQKGHAKVHYTALQQGRDIVMHPERGQ